MRTKTLIALLAAGAVVAACGGGGGDDNIAAAGPGGGNGTPTGGGGTGTAPAATSAFASVDAFVAFLRGLANDETSEPLALPAGTPAPASETAEPSA